MKHIKILDAVWWLKQTTIKKNPSIKQSIKSLPTATKSLILQHFKVTINAFENYEIRKISKLNFVKKVWCFIWSTYHRETKEKLTSPQIMWKDMLLYTNSCQVIL